MNKSVISLMLIISALSIAGCNRDEIITNNPPPGQSFTGGAYVLSEGGVTVGSSKLSYSNLATNTYLQNIFGPQILGLFPDGLIVNNNELILTEQGNFGSAGIIYRVDTTGMVKKFSSIGTNPYSLAVANNKIYVTNGPTNNVSVANRDSLNTITTINNVGVYPQEIIAIGNKVFVCNTSIFQGPVDSTVAVIDATADQIVARIVVRKKPSALAVTNDGKLLVGCPGNSVEGIIYKIDPNNYSSLDSFVISNGFAVGFDKDIGVEENSNNIYFISSLNNIVKLDISTKVHSVLIPNTNTAASFFYGYNFDNTNDIHYVADAKNFVVAGSINLYNRDGVFLNSYTTGVAPRRIAIK